MTSNVIKKLSNAVMNSELDALLIQSPSNRLYATGFQSSAGMVMILPDKRYFFTDFRYIEAAQENIHGYEIRLTDKNTKYNAHINNIISENNIKTLGFEDEYLSFSSYNTLNKLINAEFIPIKNMINNLRASKEEHEIIKMREAQRISEVAFNEILNFITPGKTEMEIAAELTYHMLRNGAQRMSFEPIVVSGANSSMPHGVPSNKRVESGDFITMDFGCVYDGYCSDMTRTVAVSHVTDEMINVYNIVLEAQLIGMAVAKAGVTGRDVDSAARKIIENAGYGEYFGHSFGHSLGIDVHESPNASQNDTNPLPEGAVISAEPGIYLPGKFGVRIEDVIILKQNGYENITKAKKSLLIL